MCELYFVKPIDRKVNSVDIDGLLSMMDAGAFFNDDGFGVTNGSQVFKSHEKFNSDKFGSVLGERFVGSDFVIGHTRLATTGKNKKINSHPFFNRRFIWLHNGIIDNYSDVALKFGLDVNVDSEVIGGVLLKKMDKHKDVVDAISSMMGELSGSFSVFIYDCVTERLFYLRNDSCSFTFRLLKLCDDFIIVGCTNECSLNDLYAVDSAFMFGFPVSKCVSYSSVTTEKDKIFEINDDGIHGVGGFKNIPVIERKAKWYGFDYGNYDSLDAWDLYGGVGDSPDLSFEDNLIELLDKERYTYDEIESIFSAYFDDDTITVVKSVSSDGKKTYGMLMDDSDLALLNNFTGIDVSKGMSFSRLCLVTKDVLQNLYADAFGYNGCDDIGGKYGRKKK